MTNPAVYQVARGSTVSLYMEAVTGDPTVATSPVCKLKSVSSPNAPIPDGSVPTALSITPVPTAASADIAAGWTITLTAVQTAALPAGYYMVDFACTIAGGEIISTPVVLQLVNAISLP